MKNDSQKCSQDVRNIPLEQFRLSTDGRKWKQAAGRRYDFLLKLSTWANPDGTFIRNGRDYSPSLKTLLKHMGHGTYYRLTDALRDLGLLSWVREKHYERRTYTIHIPKQVPDSPDPALNDDENQVPDSEITGPTLEAEDGEQVPDSNNRSHVGEEQVPHSPITGPTMRYHPSLPSLPSKIDPSNALEPSNPPFQSGGRMDGSHARLGSTSKPSPSASGQQTFKDRAQITLELKWIEYVNHFRTERGITADDEPDDYPPPGLNTSGIAKLVEVLKQDGWSVDEAGDAFYRFLREQYDRDFDTDRIKKPLSIFTRDLYAYRAVSA